MSFGGSLPSGTEIGEGGYHGETHGAESEDLAYKGLGGTVPLHSRAFSTAPSTCFALCDFYGCCKEFNFISLVETAGIDVVFAYGVDVEGAICEYRESVVVLIGF